MAMPGSAIDQKAVTPWGVLENRWTEFLNRSRSQVAISLPLGNHEL
jgi:hypothetical protein